MNLATQIIFWVPFLGTSLILAIVLFFYLTNQSRFQAFLKLALGLIIGFFLVSWLGQILILFLALKASTFSSVLLQGPNSFFVQKTINLSISFLITLLVTGFIYLVGVLMVKYQKKSRLENYVPLILLMLGLSLNFSNILPAILVAFLLALLYQLILLIIYKKSTSISVTPFLLIAAFIIHILMLFPFYGQLLGILHLI